MKLALLLIILLPLISFAQTETELITEFNVNEGKLNIVVPEVLEELNLTYIIGSMNLPKRKVIGQRTFVDTNIQEILDYLFQETKYELSFDPKKQTVHLINRRSEAQITIAGRVQSTDSGGGIVDVHVSSGDNKYQTITDQDGFYSLRVPKKLDSLNLTFSHIQFVTTSGWVVLANAIKRERIVYNKYLRLATVEMPTYNVSEEVQKTPTFPFFSNNSLEKIFFGASLDQNRFIFLTGADQYFRMEGGISFKGAPSTMNQFLLDGEQIVDPFKLKGAVPIVENVVTKGVKIYEGVAPARYAGASMVIDIIAEDGNISERQGIVLLSDQYASVTLTGPIENNSSSYFLNYRSNLKRNTFKEFVFPNIFNHAFALPTAYSEIRGKLSGYVNRDNIISFSGFYGNEVIKGFLDPSHELKDFDLSGIINKELNIIAKWDNRSFTNTKINISTSYKHYEKQFGLEENNGSRRPFAPKGLQDKLILNGNVEMALRNNLSLVVGLKNDLTFYSYGSEAIADDFRDSVHNNYNNLFQALDGAVVSRFAGFAELNRAFDKLTFSVGLRLTDFNNLIGFNSLEPRIILKYRPNLDQSNVFEVNYGRNVISEYSIFSDSINSFLEYPFIVNTLNSELNSVLPYISNELNVNYKVLFKNNLFIELGHFVKTSNNLLVEQASLLDTLNTASLPNYTMLGLSFKGALQISDSWNCSAILTYKDFINFDDSVSTLNFRYKYGFLIKNRINKKFTAMFNYLNYYEGFVIPDNGRVSTMKLGIEWILDKSFMLSAGYEYSKSNLLEHDEFIGNLDVQAVFRF